MKCPYQDCDHDVLLAMSSDPVNFRDYGWDNGVDVAGHWCPEHGLVDGEMLDQIKRRGGRSQAGIEGISPSVRHPHGRAEQQQQSDSGRPCQ